MSARSRISGPLGYAVGLGILAGVVKAGWLVPFDRWAAQWLGVVHTGWLDQVARTLTFFGSSLWTLTVMVLMSVGWVRQRGTQTLATFWGAWLCGISIQFLLRFCVAQWRPDTALVPVTSDLLGRYDLAGFTSGHSFRSAFLFGWWTPGLMRRRTAWATWAGYGCIAMIFIVGMTRVYLSRHWMTDVVGAWILAGFALALAGWLQRRVRTGPTPA